MLQSPLFGGFWRTFELFDSPPDDDRRRARRGDTPPWWSHVGCALPSYYRSTVKPDVAQSREGKSSFAAERIDGGKLRCTSWDDAVVIMPGEALVVNLDGRPTRCGPRCRALWYPRQAPDPGADDSRPLPRDAVGKPSTCAAPAARCGSGPVRQSPPSRGRMRSGAPCAGHSGTRPRQAPDPGADDSRPLPRDAGESRRPVPRPRRGLGPLRQRRRGDRMTD